MPELLSFHNLSVNVVALFIQDTIILDCFLVPEDFSNPMVKREVG